MININKSINFDYSVKHGSIEIVDNDKFRHWQIQFNCVCGLGHSNTANLYTKVLSTDRTKTYFKLKLDIQISKSVNSNQFQ